MNKKSKNHQQIKEKFIALLKDANLIAPDKLLSTSGITSWHHSYGSNYALLNHSEQASKDVGEELVKEYPNISTETASSLAATELINLFEKIGISEDADPNLEAPLGSIWENFNIEESVIEKHLNTLLENL